MAGRGQYSRSYVIPYRRVPGSGFEVLVAEKLVISCKAVSYLRGSITGRQQREWSQINWNNPVNNEGRLLDRSGRVLKIGLRLEGVLLAAGGRPCVPGGRVNRGERPEQAALRELREETTLDFRNSRLFEIHATDWGGVYYGLEIKQNVDQTIRAVNSELAQAAQRQSSVPFLNEVYNGQKPAKFEEMKALKWVPLGSVEREMAAVPSQDFLRNEVGLCAQLMFQVLGISQSTQRAQEALFNLMYNHQKVDDNVVAARKLATMLQGQ